MAGVNFLMTKKENTENPKNYRPVTCLSTMYKLITSVISRRMQTYMDDENLIPKERKFATEYQKDAKISC
jgi:hypothetical protein